MSTLSPNDFTIHQFDFELPPEQIAQSPVEPRDHSKLLVAEANGRLGNWTSAFEFSHRQFKDIADLLGPNDFLVMNDAKVLPVRILGKNRETGGAVEALLLRKNDDGSRTALMQMSAKLKPGMQFEFEPGLIAESLSTHEERTASEGEVRLKFNTPQLDEWLEQHGHVPLPPYIERADQSQDKKTYQTVYAKKSGSAAAPTAGFHFTDELLLKLKNQGVEFGSVTLHVGIGTFRPIKVERIDEHVMHEEVYEITPEFLAAYLAAKKQGKRIVAVGTTVVRTLESWARLSDLKSGVFTTQIFIKPGHKFEAVDAMITNFHLPKSSLLVLVAAAMGFDAMGAAYGQALQDEYRFFSYGDAMFIGGFHKRVLK